MGYKIGIALEVWDEAQRDRVLKELRDVLLRCQVVKGKVTTKRSIELVPGQPLDLAALGVGGESSETPLEQLARGMGVTKTP